MFNTLNKRDYLTCAALGLVSLVVFSIFAKKDYQHFNYFVPLANSLIHFKLDVPNNYCLNELVMFAGKYFVVFPPIPAILITPAVFIWGIQFNQVWASVFYGALGVFFFSLVSRKLFSQKVSIFLTLLFAFGTNFLYITAIGAGWYFAQVTGIMLMAIAVLFAMNDRPALSGLFIGLACLCRLPLILGFAVLLYLLLRNKTKEDFLRISLNFFIPLGLCVFVFGLYCFLRFGSFFQTGYSLIPGVLDLPGNRNGIMNLSYIPRSLWQYLFLLPKFSSHPPYIYPTEMGLAVWITTPALLGLFFLKSKDKLAIVFLLQALLIALAELSHGENGWCQFGMRFSLDFMIFMLLALGFVFQRVKTKYVVPVIILCILINIWGITLWHLGLSTPK